MYDLLDKMRLSLGDDKTVRFNTEVVGGIELVIVSYMISNDELWDKPFGREARGITFRADTGRIVSRPFEKFFNVGENSLTQPAHVKQDMQYCSYVADKRDGSMITPVVLDGQVYLKTKKSFYSDVALDAQKHMTAEVEGLCKHCHDFNLTPIFEFTSPRNKVVIDYGEEPKFILLAIRQMDTGAYEDRDTVERLAAVYGVEVVPVQPIGFDEMIDMVDHKEGVEGWVIYTPFARYKIKTKWYCDRHRVLDVRERDIARFALEDVLDDMKPEMVAGGCDMEAIERIENQVAHGLAMIVQSIEDYVFAAKAYEGMDQVKFIKTQCGSLQKFVFRAVRGQENTEEAIKDFYRSRFLGEFSLKSVGNPNFGAQDDGD